MAAESDSVITADAFIYPARVNPPRGRGKSVAVAFLSTVVPNGATLGNLFRDFFRDHALTAELWVVAPAFSSKPLRSLRQSETFKERLAHAATLDAVRLITFDEAGTWSEIDPEAHIEPLITAPVAQSVRTQGLRVMFRDEGGLSQAHAGLHYVKPGGSHTRQFLRAGPVVARSPLAFFAAAAILPWASARPHQRIWVDTSAIAGVGHALAALQGMFAGTPRIMAVDSFGGYERLALHAPDPGENPLVLISASTSGKLAARIEELHGIARSDILTLFYVGGESDPHVLCDLTLRDPGDTDSNKIPIIDSWKVNCPLCRNGLNALQLEGEDFVPEAIQASERMIMATHSNRNLRSLIKDFQGKRIVRVAQEADTHLGRSRTVSLELAAELSDESSPIRAQVIRDLGRQLPAQARWIVTLGDTDSNLIADLALKLCEQAGIRDVKVVGTSEMDEGSTLNGGHAFVVAGTVASGRALLNVSRQLRSANVDLIHYFIACARPRSKQAWTTLTGDLQYGEYPREYPLHNIWLVETEPDRGASAPWLLERTALQTIAAALDARSHANGHVARHVRDRLTSLDGDFDLFVASDTGADNSSLALNPNFAFWDGPYTAPTQSEVFFTMATVMHTFRYSSEGRYALFAAPGHGYVLDPLNFGRFNDPVIQASILRAATGSELDYRSHEETSRRMTDEVLYLLQHLSDAKFGGASTEFALSIARGLADCQSPGALRLHSSDRQRYVDGLAEVSGEQFPLLHALGEFIRFHVYTDEGTNGSRVPSVGAPHIEEPETKVIS